MDPIEASLTALLLGELPHEQADALHLKLAQDPELAKLYERLKHTISLVRETVASPAPETAAQPVPLKLADDRRQKLLAHFKTIAPKEFTRPRRSPLRWLAPVAAAAALVLILGALVLPMLEPAKTRSFSLGILHGVPESGESAAELSIPRRAPSESMEALTERSHIPSANRLGERFASETQDLKEGAPTLPLGGQAESKLKAASASIVLPKAPEPASANETTPATGQAGWSVSAGLRGLSDDSSGRSAGITTGGGFGSFETGARGRSSLAGGRQKEAAPAQDFFSQPAAMGRLEVPPPVASPPAEAGRGVVVQSSSAPVSAPAAPALTVTSPSDGQELQKVPPVAGLVADAAEPSPRAYFGLPLSPAKPAAAAAGTSLRQPDSGVAARRSETLNYQWNLDATAQPATPNSAGQQLPVLGDTPTLGKYLYNAGQLSQSQASLPEGEDRAKERITAGALQLEGVEKAKSVELADNGALDQGYAAQSQRVAQAQKKADELRARLEISDGFAGGEGASPLMTADTLRKLGNLRIESQAELAREQTQLGRLQDRGPGQNAEQLGYGVVALSNSLNDLQKEVALARSNDLARADQTRTWFEAKRRLDELQRQRAENASHPDATPAKPATAAPVPQPEVQTADNAFSTFSLNVSDVSFRLAAASLEKGVMPEPATVRSEEFLNAFDYRDPEPPPGVPVAFAWERAQDPFAQSRDLLRFSIKTAALGRQPGRPLNLVLLLDNSGSMERADRVRIIHEALRVLAGQLQPQDKLSVVTFSRTAHLWVDGVPGSQAAQVVEEVSGLTPQGGTNLEDAMNLAYQTALRHYLANGVNRVVLLTDGAANLGNVDPEALKQKVEANRKQGIALDCFGIGWEGYNDDLLEVLSRNGDGRYGFINAPEEAATEFAGQLAGALHVAASDVKVQVEFNPARVTAYRQIGYAKHQLTKEQFRDNTVDAAEIGAAESGNALYVIAVNPGGTGPLATVRVRYKVSGTTDYREHAWPVPYTGNALPLDQASPAMRLAATASTFSEWLASSPYAGEVSLDQLLGYLSGVPEVYGADTRPKKLEWMIRQVKAIAGK